MVKRYHKCDEAINTLGRRFLQTVALEIKETKNSMAKAKVNDEE